TPRLDGIKYFEKPALQYWLTAAAYEAFGIHQWTARLWPALAGFAGALFIGYVGFRLGGPRLGLYSAAALGGCLWYVLNTHILTNEHHREGAWWYFIPILAAGILPWLTVLAWTAPRMWSGPVVDSNGFSWQRFALVWSAFIFVFFSLSSSKLPSYILPIFPAL